MIGAHNSPTMQLLAKIEGVEVSVLVDLGSIHNLLREKLIPKLALKVWKKACLNVYLANGECIPRMGVCKSVPFEVGEDILQADIYASPLEGLDVVLGSNGFALLDPSRGISTP